MNAIQIKILLAILAVLTVIATWEVHRDKPVQMDPVGLKKSSNGARPLTKPYLVP